MISAIDRIIFQLLDLCFHSNKNFTDTGLTNFEKSAENLTALNSITLNFDE